MARANLAEIVNETKRTGVVQEAMMMLTLNIIMGGALTGAAFNPARAVGPMVAIGNFTMPGFILAAPIMGAIVAALLHTGLTKLAQDGMAAGNPGRATQTPAE